jgi:hypothetical protein
MSSFAHDKVQRFAEGGTGDTPFSSFATWTI